MANKIKVTLYRSLIGRPENQRAVVKTLGLSRVNSSVFHDDTPTIRGMIKKVEHLVNVQEIEA